MAKLNFAQLAQAGTKPKGIVVASLFSVPKVGGYSFKWKGKVKNEAGELVDISGKDLIENLLETGCFNTDSQGRSKGMLVVQNTRKREGKRDPDFLVFAYPDVK